MRKSAVVLIGALMVVSVAAFVVPAFAATQTVTGQLIDMLCYSQNRENIGNAHRNKGYVCGQACAREGFPVAVLTADGKVYQVTGALAADKNAKLVPHIAQMVTVTGDVSEKDGITLIAGSDLNVINKP
jgi:hypothetical protein